MATQKKPRKRRTHWQRVFDDMVDGLVEQAMLAAMAETYHGIRASNDDVTSDQAYDIALGVLGEQWVMDKVVDAACDVMCEEELPEHDVAQARVTSAACTAAAAAFAMRHKWPAGRA